jgi:Holliday junction resolvase RusA-like endonuclease|tara:strand:- start:75 stop:785 length:711 start_codon:yes stop_codon:yes gene_type:complete
MPDGDGDTTPSVATGDTTGDTTSDHRPSGASSPESVATQPPNEQEVLSPSPPPQSQDHEYEALQTDWRKELRERVREIKARHQAAPSELAPPRSWSAELSMLPPSTNHLYREVHDKKSGKRFRVKTGPYKKFLKATVGDFLPFPGLTRPVRISVKIYGGRGWRESADVSNRLKACEDALVKAGRLEDDDCRRVRAVTAEYIPRDRHYVQVHGFAAPTKSALQKIEARCVVEVEEVE